MKPAIYGDTFQEFLFNEYLNHTNKTQTKEGLKWNMYQYGTCAMFVIAGCVIVCPLLQRRNYKSKQRQKILVIDACSLLFCLLRCISLLFSFEQDTIATAIFLLTWSAGTTFLITSLAVFLFILWSTTKLEPMIWHFQNTLAIALIFTVNLVTIVFKELAMLFSYSRNIFTSMTNLLLVSSMVNGVFYLALGLCLCGTFKKMTRNRRPSIRLVKESAKLRFIRTKVVHTDVENFQTMVRKIRVIAVLTFLTFALNFYMNIRMLVFLNYTKQYRLNELEIYALEISARLIEISLTSLIFCIGFFSPQHKEAAKQWIRSWSISRSHEELSTRRTNSVDSGRDTASDAKSRAGTLDVCTTEINSETVADITPSPVSKHADNSSPENVSLLKQDAKFLMVPSSLPLMIDIGETKGNTR